MARVCVLLMMVCLSNQTIADAGQTGQRAELQVGGLLRMIERDIERDEAVDSEASEKHAEKLGAPTPSESEAPPSNGAIDTKVQVQDDLPQDQTQVPSLVYPLNGSVSIGIDYSFIEAEDLAADRAVEGIVDVDHQSHHLLFRASWHLG